MKETEAKLDRLIELTEQMLELLKNENKKNVEIKNLTRFDKTGLKPNAETMEMVKRQQTHERKIVREFIFGAQCEHRQDSVLEIPDGTVAKFQ